MPQPRVVFESPVSPLRILCCGFFVVAAVILALAALVLRLEVLGWLAGASYLASCLSIQWRQEGR